MFQSKNNRYVTRSIYYNLSPKMQVFLWQLVDNQVRKGNKMDYLQKFELKVTDVGQEIKHSQENPKKSYTIVLPIGLEDCINKTVWIIDDIEYQTMLFPEDY